MFTAWSSQRPIDDFIDAVVPRLGLLHSALEALELVGRIPYFGEGPWVRNRAYWKNPSLVCGYGYVSNAPIFAREVLTSYLGVWNHARQEHGVGGRVARMGLSYAAENSWSEGFRFIQDLYENGYLVRVRDLAIAAAGLADIYVRGADLDLKQVDLSSDAGEDRTDALLDQHSERPPDLGRAEQLIDWYCDYANERIRDAREAGSADEWVLHYARLAGLLECLRPLNAKYGKDVELSPATRATLSLCEEIRSDLGAYARLLLLISRDNRPLKPNRTVLYIAASMYRSRLGEGYLEKLFLDRLVLPRALMEVVSSVSDVDNLNDNQLPPGWRSHSAEIGLPLCIALGRDPDFARDVDFSLDEIDAECARLGYDRSGTNLSALLREIRNMSGESSGRPEQPHEDDLTYSDEVRAAARESLINDELRGGLEAMFSEPESRPEALRRMRQLYPWNADILLENGIDLVTLSRLGHCCSRRCCCSRANGCPGVL